MVSFSARQPDYRAGKALLRHDIPDGIAGFSYVASIFIHPRFVRKYMD
jgi:hypothetical protein